METNEEKYYKDDDDDDDDEDEVKYQLLQSSTWAIDLDV